MVELGREEKIKNTKVILSLELTNVRRRRRIGTLTGKNDKLYLYKVNVKIGTRVIKNLEFDYATLKDVKINISREALKGIREAIQELK